MAAKKVKTKTKTKAPKRAARTSAANGKAHDPIAVAANGSERIERRRYKEKLPCAIDAAMVVLRGDELAKAVREREEFAVDNAERNRQARERRAHLDEKISDLATAVEQHSESREVECVEYLVRGQIEVWREDTQELVTTKAANAEDLQESIFRKSDAARAEADADAPKAAEKDMGELFPDAVHSSFEDDDEADGEVEGDQAVEESTTP